MGDFFNTIMAPIEWLVAWIMFGFHAGLTSLGMPEASGWTWALSIVGLVIVMRAAMIPLFFKQIMASRKMQMIQPELQKIQKKYKGKSDPESRQAMTQETMALYKKEGTNPFSSCLPILAQSPFFFGLFQVLNGLDDIARGDKDFVGPINREVAAQAESASVFGAQLSDTFLGSDAMNTKIVTVILIVLMSATTFLTQRQLITKNMPASALDNPFAKQQKLLLYVLPVVFAVSGVNFPLGVLIYWFTTNVWSMCQQFYVIRRLPAPGSAAEKAYHARLAKKGKPIPGAAEAAAAAAAAEAAEADKPTGQRAQPASKKRKKKQGAGGAAKPGQQPRQPGAPGQDGQGAPRPSGQNGQKTGPPQGRKKPGAAAKPPTT
ncbi:membrane protein insertase YidC [Oryzobacter sp. R7]|uniref:membrane protein insertase YidC n=1 Tax=Oryzobacter faecalis TaxID=3388656 RepID=UPI00398D01E8